MQYITPVEVTVTSSGLYTNSMLVYKWTTFVVLSLQNMSFPVLTYELLRPTVAHDQTTLQCNILHHQNIVKEPQTYTPTA
jgi:hypothetical protein